MSTAEHALGLLLMAVGVLLTGYTAYADLSRATAVRRIDRPAVLVPASLLCLLAGAVLLAL